MFDTRCLMPDLTIDYLNAWRLMVISVTVSHCIGFSSGFYHTYTFALFVFHCDSDLFVPRP